MKTEERNPLNAAVKRMADKFQCPFCHAHPLSTASWPAKIACGQCHAEFPIVAGRFPDFLSPTERKSLESELAFWKQHFPGTEVYHDESPESYAEWANLFG